MHPLTDTTDPRPADTTAPEHPPAPAPAMSAPPPLPATSHSSVSPHDDSPAADEKTGQTVTPLIPPKVASFFPAPADISHSTAPLPHHKAHDIITLPPFKDSQCYQNISNVSHNTDDDQNHIDMTSFIIDDVPTHSTPKRQRFEKDNQTTQRTPDT